MTSPVPTRAPLRGQVPPKPKPTPEFIGIKRKGCYISVISTPRRTFRWHSIPDPPRRSLFMSTFVHTFRPIHSPCLLAPLPPSLHYRRRVHNRLSSASTVILGSYLPRATFLDLFLSCLRYLGFWQYNFRSPIESGIWIHLASSMLLPHPRHLNSNSVSTTFSLNFRCSSASSSSSCPSTDPRLPLVGSKSTSASDLFMSIPSFRLYPSGRVKPLNKSEMLA